MTGDAKSCKIIGNAFYYISIFCILTMGNIALSSVLFS